MRKTFALPKFNWEVEVIWYKKEVTQEGVKAIEDLLKQNECHESRIEYMVSMIRDKNVNSASIYSNNKSRKSILIIGNTSSDYELVNSITHEAIHLSRHINLCGNSESLATEIGDLAGNIYKSIQENQ